MNRSETARRPRRPGFTLIELVVALGLTSIVSAALMSALLLSLRAIPASDDGGMTAARLDAACEFVLADAMLASELSIHHGGDELRLVVPDITGDGDPDDVVLEFKYGELIRRVNNGDKRVLAEGIASGLFTLETAGTRITAVTLVIKTDHGSVHRAGVECLARPEE